MLALLLLLLPFQQPPELPISEGMGAPNVSIPRIETTVQVDGLLDESAWSKAARLGGFSQYQPVDGRPAEEKTEVLIWYSPEAIHFGILAYDRDATAIRATVADRDNLDRDDTVTIYLDTFSDRRRAFLFTVNPLGVQQDGVQTEGQFTAGNMFGGTIDKSPDYRFDSAGRLTADGYQVEVRVPFKSLRYPGGNAQRWLINFKRKTQRTGYEDTWTDLRRGRASFLAQSGSIDGIHDIRRGVVTEIQPFVTMAANGSRSNSSAPFERDEVQWNPGVNMRLGFTNISLDGTIKPDFSTVESDTGQVTVNERFALFYPEKRPFFLEGIELFSTPNQLVYTRQIVKPIVGGKVTGKLNRFGFGYLSAIDDTESGHVNYNIFRIRRDLGTSSLAGVTYTDKTGQGDFNRVLAADTRLVFAKLYFIQGQLGRSWTGEQGIDKSAPLWEGQFDRTGRSWGFNYTLKGIGNDFQAQSGYVPRNSIVEGHAFNRLSWYGRRGAPVENITAFFRIQRIWDYRTFSDRAPIEGDDGLNINAQLRGGWTLTGRLARGFYDFTPSAYEDYSVDAGQGVVLPFNPPGRAGGLPGFSMGFSTPTFKIYNLSIQAQRERIPIFPEASEGEESRWTGTLAMRPSESLRIDASGTVSYIRRRRDDSEFARTLIPRLKVEYQPRRSLFFRVVSEFRSQRQASLEDPRTGQALLIGGLPSSPEVIKSLRLDWLFSYEPVPGTAFYCGYGSSLEADERTNYTDMKRASDGFFVKLAYLFTR